MINIRIGNKEYKIDDKLVNKMYTPVIDHSLPEIQGEPPVLSESGGKLNRTGYAHYSHVIRVFAQRIKELEEQLNAKP